MHTQVGIVVAGVLEQSTVGLRNEVQIDHQMQCAELDYVTTFVAGAATLAEKQREVVVRRVSRNLSGMQQFCGELTANFVHGKYYTHCSINNFINTSYECDVLARRVTCIQQIVIDPRFFSFLAVDSFL